ncbi:MAG: hypothetical protein ACRDK2_15630 [Solirubrobacteraceae bacterium]
MTPKRLWIVAPSSAVVVLLAVGLVQLARSPGPDANTKLRALTPAQIRRALVGSPSYYDHSGALGEQITDSSFMPVTVFYNSLHQRYIHQGQYPSLEKLEADIERYALRS